MTPSLLHIALALAIAIHYAAIIAATWYLRGHLLNKQHRQRIEDKNRFWTHLLNQAARRHFDDQNAMARYRKERRAFNEQLTNACQDAFGRGLAEGIASQHRLNTEPTGSAALLRGKTTQPNLVVLSDPPRSPSLCVES